MEMTLSEWRFASTTTSSREKRLTVGSMDIPMSELAMRRINVYFESLSISEERLMLEFDQSRGDTFERFFGSVGASGS